MLSFGTTQQTMIHVEMVKALHVPVMWVAGDWKLNGLAARNVDCGTIKKKRPIAQCNSVDGKVGGVDERDDLSQVCSRCGKRVVVQKMELLWLTVQRRDGHMSPAYGTLCFSKILMKSSSEVHVQNVSIRSDWRVLPRMF